jgi:pre-mRNA-splicing factor ATP-dependent RNA helicase DHX38/PRP16
MGNAVGVKAENAHEGETLEAKLQADGEVDYKKSSGFAAHITKREMMDHVRIAMNKSMRQQREYLPVYSVRDELLNVVRENTVVIIVGETGSGEDDPIDSILPSWKRDTVNMELWDVHSLEEWQR